MDTILEPVPLRPRRLPSFVVHRHALSKPECRDLLSNPTCRSPFYKSRSQQLARKVEYAYITPSHAPWLFDRVGRLAARRNVWGLALTAIADPMRLQRYRRHDYSDVHSDYDYPTTDHSKLTVVIPLVSPSEWHGGELEIGNDFQTPRLRLGDAVIFPSFVPHRVTRVTGGTRLILSAWISGPQLR